MVNLILFFTFLVSSSAYSTDLSFAVIGDAGNLTPELSLIRKSIKRSKVKNLILPGDNLYNVNLSYEDVWDRFLNDGMNFSVVALGNHNLSIDAELSYFKMPDTYYHKVQDGIHFLVLDSEQLVVASKQAHWLKLQLSKLNKEDTVIIVFHHPPVTISQRHHWWEREKFHKATLPDLIMNKEKIDLILVGHDHIASLFTINNLPVIVSGATMEVKPAPSLDYWDRDRNLAVKTIWHFNNKDPYWTRLDIDPLQKHIWVNFVNAKYNRVECSIMIKDGIIFKKKNCTTSPHATLYHAPSIR